MRKNAGMGGEPVRVRYWAALLIVLACVGGGAAVWALKSHQNAGYWISGASLVVGVVTPGLSLVVQRESRRQGNKVRLESRLLREALVDQWQEEIQRQIGYPNPLQVPFAVTRRTEVMASWDAIRGGTGGAALPMDGTFKDISDVFTRPDMPPRLVILGEPGTGKSTIAQWLMLKLLDRAIRERGAEQENRVPFFLPLASWDPSVPLEDWVAAKMIETYGRLGASYTSAGGEERTLARELVARHLVLMVLDGMDEMAPRHQPKALDLLSDAVTAGHAMVLTCRAEQYEAIVKRAHHGPLRATPVIELGPLPVAAIRTYLNADLQPTDHRWDSVLAHLAEAPACVHAAALSTPLMVWLARTVYGCRLGGYDDYDDENGHRNAPPRKPEELLSEASEEDIKGLLLGGLVEAAYAPKVKPSPPKTKPYPGRAAAEGSPLHDQIVSLAIRTSRQKDGKQNIDWWRIHEMCHPLVIGLTMGLIVGPLLGAAAGLAVTVKAGHVAGLTLGVVFGIAAGALAGLTCVRPQPNPRTVHFALSWNRMSGWLPRCLLFGLAVGVGFSFAAERHGGLVAGLVVAAISGPTAAWAAWSTFGKWPATTAGITAALALGLAAGLASGHSPALIAGPAAGVAFAIGAWVWIGAYETAESRMAINPQSLLKNDRLGCMVVGVTAGIAFGVVYGLALGLAVGVIAVVSLTIVVTLVVSLWGTFSVARLWLAARGGLPLGIMSFLQEAYDRGVLRQEGPHYKFRHLLLHQRLAGDSLQPASSETAQPSQRESASQLAVSQPRSCG